MQHRNVLPQQQHNEKPRNINNNSNNQIQVHRKIQSSQGLRQLQQKHLQNNAINNNNPVKSYINTPPKIERKNDANNYVKIFNKNNNGIPKIGHKIKLVSKPINAVAPHFKNKQQFRSLSSYVQDFGKHSEQNVYSPMEDTLDYNVNFYADNDRTISYFAVFDGCGGAQVSSYLKSNFQKILLSHLKHNNFDICPSFKNAFIDAETQLAQSLQSSLVQSESQMQMPLTSPASTAVIILVMNNEIHSINIGDSSSFYVDNNNIVKLSVEHNMTNEQEVKRVRAAGATVFNKKVFGVLSLTRCVGGFDYKECGVVAEPHFAKVKIKGTGREVVVLGSDGLFDGMNEFELKTFIKENKAMSGKELSKLLVQEAINKGSVDNISCIAIKIGK